MSLEKNLEEAKELYPPYGTKEHMPEFEIVKTTIEEIERSVKIKSVKYASDVYKFLLSRDAETCEISLPHDFLADLNAYTGSRKSKYWLALENNLKKRLSIAMQNSGLVPFSSDIFFEDIQDWEQDDGRTIKVFLSKEDYKIFQDGLEQIYRYLEEQRMALSHLKLKKFPYEEDQKYINNMLLVRNKQISDRGPCGFRDSISVTSRMHLKAAAIIELMFLENEMLHKKHTGAVKKEIDEKAGKILAILSSPTFERIEVAEYLRASRDKAKSTPDKHTKAKDATPEYAVVISFAGEDREHAEKLTKLLKDDCFAVFYDKDEEHDLWGKNLYEHLTEVYSKRGKYCVMFLSKHYAAKQWPTLERRSAQERALRESREYILPIRIDDTEIPGIHGTVGYQDLREKSIEAIYEILKKKLLS